MSAVTQKDTHTTEFFVVSQETVLTDFSDARAASGKITADFLCDASLVTTAGDKGSLEKATACSAIEMDSSRPFWWNIPVPPMKPEGPLLQDCTFNACQADLPAADTPAPITPAPTPNPTRPPTPAPVSAAPITPAPTDKKNKKAKKDRKGKKEKKVKGGM